MVRDGTLGHFKVEDVTEVEQVISDVYVSKASFIGKLTNVVGSPRHFFELVRFDFVGPVCSVCLRK